MNGFQGFPDVDGERQHGGRFSQEFANVGQARLSTLGLEWQREQQEELLGVRNGLLGECQADNIDHLQPEKISLYISKLLTSHCPFQAPPSTDMMYHLAPGPNRRDSAMSNDSLLSVESVRYGGGVSPAGSGAGGGGGGASSGCASAEGSTDSLLEQEMHNLSLSVTEQALE